MLFFRVCLRFLLLLFVVVDCNHLVLDANQMNRNQSMLELLNLLLLFSGMSFDVILEDFMKKAPKMLSTRNRDQYAAQQN